MAFLILSFSHFLLFSAGAQTFTQRLQQKQGSQGTVTITQSAEIDKLVNSEILTPAKPAASTTSASQQPSAAKPAASNANGSQQASASGQQASAGDKQEAEAPDTSKKVMRGGVKVNGFRVQAFAGGNSRKDRQQAEQIGNTIKAQYPNVPVYVHFYTPRWICRVGNYRTYEEAHQMLVALRGMGYSQASIVKGKITVQY